MTLTDFYIASTEWTEMEQPRRCRAVARLRNESRDDLLLIGIDPPLIGQQFGLGGRDIDQIVVATRHQGESLFPISRWPVFVHVARLLIYYEGQEFVRNHEIAVIAWAELYATEEHARTKHM